MTDDAWIERLRQLHATGRGDELREALRGIDLAECADPAARLELGRIYLELGYPAMAGLLWYLEEPTSSAMSDAVREFEHSRGDSPRLILDAVSDLLEGDRTEYGCQRVELLYAAADRRAGKVLAAPSFTHRVRSALLTVGCFGALLAIVVVFLAGIFAVASWFGDMWDFL